LPWYGDVSQVLSSKRLSPFRGKVTLQKCILIVDDSQTIRTAVRNFLECQPAFTVCGEAVDGFDALEKVLSLSPDLIILDLSMPRMNGLQTARELRARLIPVPIILFTMYAEELQPQDVATSGISAVVSKTNLPVLQLQIERLLVAAS
jgi:two-component system response regulator DegU